MAIPSRSTRRITCVLLPAWWYDLSPSASLLLFVTNMQLQSAFPSIANIRSDDEDDASDCREPDCDGCGELFAKSLWQC